MKRILVTLTAVSAMVPFFMTGSTATAGLQIPKGVKLPSGTTSIDPANFVHAAPPGTGRAITPPTITPSVGTVGCSDRSSTNVRANQECTNQVASGYQGRAQSQNETSVAVNPKNSQNVLISQNDYRLGDGHCGVDYSLDGGKHFGSEVAPQNFGRAFINPSGSRHYWTSGGDTSVAFDSTGEAYLMCQVFNRGFPTDEQGDREPFGPSGFEIFRSADGGASWSFPGDYVATSVGMARGGPGLLDKEYMAIDNNPTSPYRDRIYVAWVNYNTDFTSAPIYLAYSVDHGATWHQDGQISGTSPECPVPTTGLGEGDGGGGGDGARANSTDRCDNDQFPEPFIGPNGEVYVVFVNGNNCRGGVRGCDDAPSENKSQILLVKSTDGGRTFGAPTKVADYYELPDCYTYTGEPGSFGRSCVVTTPPSGRSVFRAANYPTGVALSGERVVIDFASYINQHSNPQRPAGNGFCAPSGINPDTFLPLYDGVGVVNGCNNDIVISTSNDGGATFDGATTPVSQLPSRNDEGEQLADQWFQWSTLDRAGGKLFGDSYYDRKYGNDEQTGNMDYTLATTTGHVRVTDVSMPPSNEFPGASGYSLFMGDYTGLGIGRDGVAHPAWEDTRNPIFLFNLAPDPRALHFAGYGGDIYTAAIPISGSA